MKVAITAFLIVGVLVGVLEKVSWAQALQNSTAQVVLPLQQLTVRTTRTLERPVVSIPRWYRAQARLEALQNEYAEALARTSELERLERENTQLRQLLESPSTERRTVAAPIVSYAVPTVAAGSQDGVQEGQLLYSNSTVVGRVAEVHERSAQVVLLTSKQSEPILAQTDTGEQGLLQGTGTQVIFTQVSITSQIPAGSSLTAVGQPGVPPGSFLGVTRQTTSRESEPVQTLLVDQLTSFYTTALIEIK